MTSNYTGSEPSANNQHNQLHNIFDFSTEPSSAIQVLQITLQQQCNLQVKYANKLLQLVLMLFRPISSQIHSDCGWHVGNATHTCNASTCREPPLVQPRDSKVNENHLNQTTHGLMASLQNIGFQIPRRLYICRPGPEHTEKEGVSQKCAPLMRYLQTKAHQLEPDGTSAEFMKAVVATYKDADVLGPINPVLKLHNVCVQYSTLLQCKLRRSPSHSRT